MPTEKPRYTITVDEELLKKIDDFRFEKRYQSRTAATIDLIKLGVEAFEKNQSVKNKESSSKSENDGD